MSRFAGRNSWRLGRSKHLCRNPWLKKKKIKLISHSKKNDEEKNNIHKSISLLNFVVSIVVKSINNSHELNHEREGVLYLIQNHADLRKLGVHLFYQIS